MACALLIATGFGLGCSRSPGLPAAAADAAASPAPDLAPPEAASDTATAPVQDLAPPVADHQAEADNAPNLCGNGRIDPGENCDDGNTLSNDGCSKLCLIECPWGSPPRCEGGGVNVSFCGDGRQTVNEACDDGNNADYDGCSSRCEIETGWRCPVPGRHCIPICGDGLTIYGHEDCDDGNTIDHDGCSSDCLVEPCWASDCGDASRPICGDGIIRPGEDCDDGAANSDDAYGGCTTRCKFGAYCGDGIVNGSEYCDAGPDNGKTSGKGACSFGCTRVPYCGDGIVDSMFGEECDFGEQNGHGVPCTDDCQFTLIEY